MLHKKSLQFYRIVSVDDDYMTKPTKQLPDLDNQVGYLGAEVLLLCHECSLGTITEDKIYDYARRIMYIISLNFERIDYNLSIEIAHLLKPIALDTSLCRPELSLDDALETNMPIFRQLMDTLLELCQTYERTIYG